MTSEPVVVGGAITALTTSLIALLGLVFKWSTEVQAAVALCVTNAIVVLTVVFVRGKVTANANLPTKPLTAPAPLAGK